MASIEILEQQAIEAAINSDWKKAIEFNTAIVKLDSHNIDSYLRLGYAYLQQNNLKGAQRFYKKALRIQPKNILALEHLEKIEILESKNKSKSASTVKYAPDLFLEVPGKTKTIQLVNLGKKEDLAGLSIGQEVTLKEKKRRLEVRTHDNEYIGSLPDDISKRLLYFMKEKSTYKTYVKDIDFSEVVVFVKEVIKGNKVKHYPSFPSNPHVMLTDIHQMEEEAREEEDKEDKPEGEEGEEDDEETDIEQENWGGFEEEEEKEDLEAYDVDVEEEEEEEE